MAKFDEKKKMILEKIGKFKLYLLVTIVDRDRAKKVNEVLAEKNIKSQFLWFAEGTAKSVNGVSSTVPSEVSTDFNSTLR